MNESSLTPEIQTPQLELWQFHPNTVPDRTLGEVDNLNLGLKGLWLNQMMAEYYHKRPLKEQDIPRTAQVYESSRLKLFLDVFLDVKTLAQSIADVRKIEKNRQQLNLLIADPSNPHIDMEEVYSDMSELEVRYRFPHIRIAADREAHQREVEKRTPADLFVLAGELYETVYAHGETAFTKIAKEHNWKVPKSTVLSGKRPFDFESVSRKLGGVMHDYVQERDSLSLLGQSIPRLFKPGKEPSAEKILEWIHPAVDGFHKSMLLGDQIMRKDYPPVQFRIRDFVFLVDKYAQEFAGRYNLKVINNLEDDEQFEKIFIYYNENALRELIFNWMQNADRSLTDLEYAVAERRKNGEDVQVSDQALARSVELQIQFVRTGADQKGGKDRIGDRIYLQCLDWGYGLVDKNIGVRGFRPGESKHVNPEIKGTGEGAAFQKWVLWNNFGHAELRIADRKDTPHGVVVIADFPALPYDPDVGVYIVPEKT